MELKENEHIVGYTSRVNPDFNVYVVYKEHEGYKTIRGSLEKLNNSIGALWVGTKNIFVDGERVADENIDQDQLLALEAHEIAHSMLGHEAGIDEKSEKEADLLAIALLTMDACWRAADILKARMFDLYGINYDEFEAEYAEEDMSDWDVTLQDGLDDSPFIISGSL